MDLGYYCCMICEGDDDPLVPRSLYKLFNRRNFEQGSMVKGQPTKSEYG